MELFVGPLADCSTFFFFFVFFYLCEPEHVTPNPAETNLSNQRVSCLLIIRAWLLCQSPHNHTAFYQPPLPPALLNLVRNMCLSVHLHADQNRVLALLLLPLRLANLQTLDLIGPEWKFRFWLKDEDQSGPIVCGSVSRATQGCLHGTGEMATWGRGCSTKLQPHVCKGRGAEQGCVICETLNRVLACGQFRSFPVCFSSLAVTVVAAQTCCHAASHSCIHKPYTLFQSFPVLQFV